MNPYRNTRGLGLRLGLIIGALLPFIVCLFLLPEPSEAEADDYLPSARARSVNVKIVKLVKSLPSARTAGADLVACGHLLALANFSIAIRAESPVQTRHFDLLVHRPVRSPPNFSL
jgi:hypothetical protein